MCELCKNQQEPKCISWKILVMPYLEKGGKFHSEMRLDINKLAEQVSRHHQV